VDRLTAVIRLAYAHARWADARILATAEGLTDAQFTAPYPSGTGSIRDTLVHTLTWRRWWLEKMLARPVSPMSDPADFPTLARVRDAWHEEDAFADATLVGWNEAALAAEVVYSIADAPPWVHPRWEMLLHQVDHALQHRSELALRLTDLGHSPGELALIFLLEPSPAREG
jgi:uncharacterized damage-inducible protein DinB